MSATPLPEYHYRPQPIVRRPRRSRPDARTVATTLADTIETLGGFLMISVVPAAIVAYISPFFH